MRVSLPPYYGKEVKAVMKIIAISSGTKKQRLKEQQKLETEINRL